MKKKKIKNLQEWKTLRVFGVFGIFPNRQLRLLFIGLRVLF